MNRSTESDSGASSFQHREWAVQRGGWFVLTALLLAAGAGLFGRGPLARATVRDERGWQLAYERFARAYAPTRLTVTLPATESRDTVHVWIDRDYADRVAVDESDPSPVSTAVLSDRLIYGFLVNGPAPVRITFNIEPQSIGQLKGRMGVDDSTGVAFSQFVFP